jgi:hypothetical protein
MSSNRLSPRLIARTLRTATLAVLAAGALGAHAQAERSWTTIGAVGAVTPAQQNLVEHSINWARVPAATASANVTLRYNITATDGLFPGGPVLSNFAFGMRHIDNGGSAQVITRLRAYDQDSGLLETLASMDSNSFPQSSSAQDVFQCIPSPAFDFGRKVYFVEVVLNKTASAGRPQIGAVWLTPTGCFVSP